MQNNRIITRLLSKRQRSDNNLDMKQRLINKDISIGLETNGYYIVRNALQKPDKYLIRLRENRDIHSLTMWQLRYAMKPYFANIWETDNLVCSFDGNSIDNMYSLPWHVDQNMSHEDGLVCVQGVLALTNSNATELLVKSHLYFKQFGPRNTTNNPHEFESYGISMKDHIWAENLEIFKPKLNPGDMLLFDSRLIHRVVGKGLRSVVYISMVPRSFVSEEILKKRKMGFDKGIQTTHWCTRFINVNEGTSKPEVETNDLV